jgi:FKBP-type peptidyl-prolyl cis-trans isomerase
MKINTKIVTLSLVFFLSFGLFALALNFIPNFQMTQNKTVADDEVLGTDNTTSASSELLIETIVEGTGEGAVVGDTLSVNYLGTFLDGTKFDSSYDRNEPFEFELGSGYVIQGWDQGLVGMKVGEKRKLTIPSDLAYGVNGSGSIPGDTNLIFEIELLEIK